MRGGKCFRLIIKMFTQKPSFVAHIADSQKDSYVKSKKYQWSGYLPPDIYFCLFPDYSLHLTEES